MLTLKAKVTRKYELATADRSIPIIALAKFMLHYSYLFASTQRLLLLYTHLPHSVSVEEVFFKLVCIVLLFLQNVVNRCSISVHIQKVTFMRGPIPKKACFGCVLIGICVV